MVSRTAIKMADLDGIGDDLSSSVHRAAASAQGRVERVGDELERAVSDAMARRPRHRRALRLIAAAALLIGAGITAIVVAGHDGRKQSTAPAAQSETVTSATRATPVAASSRIKVYRIVPRSGIKAGCFRVNSQDGQRQIMCPTGQERRFATYALTDDRGTAAFYGRAAIPGASGVVLRFPGGRSFHVALQDDGFWAWDGPPEAVARTRYGLVVFAVSEDGRVLARDGSPAARRGRSRRSVRPRRPH